MFLLALVMGPSLSQAQLGDGALDGCDQDERELIGQTAIGRVTEDEATPDRLRCQPRQIRPFGPISAL